MIIKNMNNIDIFDISKFKQNLILNQNIAVYTAEKGDKSQYVTGLSLMIGEIPALLLWGSLWFIPLIFVAWFLWRRNKSV